MSNADLHTNMRVIDSFFLPMVARMWSTDANNEEEIERLTSKLSTLALPDDVVRKAEQDALEAILAD